MRESVVIGPPLGVRRRCVLGRATARSAREANNANRGSVAPAPLLFWSSRVLRHGNTGVGRQMDITLDNSTSYVIGYVKLHITEAALSLTLIEEINPIDVYALIGNVGGLWGESRITGGPRRPIRRRSRESWA